MNDVDVKNLVTQIQSNLTTILNSVGPLRQEILDQAQTIEVLRKDISDKDQAIRDLKTAIDAQTAELVNLGVVAVEDAIQQTSIVNP